MIIYSSVCLSCKRKDLWLKVKDFARKNKLEIEVRRTNYNPEYKLEAEKYGVQLPFAVFDKYSGILADDTERLAINLDDLLRNIPE